MNTRKLSAFAAKYKYVLIILLAGLILLLLPTGSRTKAKTGQPFPSRHSRRRSRPRSSA